MERMRIGRSIAAVLVLMSVAVGTAGVAGADVAHQYSTGPTVTFDRVVVNQGDQITWTSTGWQPGTAVSMVVNSHPVDLGAAIADSLGGLSYTWTVPVDFEPGTHSVTLTGVALAGSLTTISGTFDVTALAGALAGLTTTVPGDATLPVTGGSRTWSLVLLASVLVVGGLALSVEARRRVARRAA